MTASAVGDTARRSGRSFFALDGLNVAMPEIAAGIGPFLVIWMSTTLHWRPGRIGVLMGVSGMVGVLAQAPAGALVDRAGDKRWLIFLAAAVIAAACATMMWWPSYPVVTVAQSAIGMVGALLGPTVAAISLGMVGRAHLEHRLGRNASLGAIGNVAMAVILGIAGFIGGYRVMFVFVISMAMVTAMLGLAIRRQDIDNRLARGADPDAAGHTGVEPWHRIFRDRRLRIFAACAVLFHFANAVLLTLVAQLFGHNDAAHASLYLAAAVALTQLIVVPLGIGVGRIAGRWPRKPIFALAFLILPLRCVLYAADHHSLWLLALQVLDGVAAGIFGVMQVLVVADLTHGTGRFNLATGSIGMAVGLGAALSNTAGGFLVGHGSYNAAFLAMAGVATVAAITFLRWMPETRDAVVGPPLASTTTA